MADATEQLQLNIKINEAIKERNALMEKQRSLIIDQIALSQELCNALECVDTDKMSENILKTREALESLFKASEKLDKLPNNFDKTKKATAGLGATAAAATSWWKGMGTVIGTVTGKIGNFVKGAWSIVKSLAQVAKSIISIPFKALDGLIDMSNRFGVITEYARALEDVREKFGDLEKGTGRILKNGMAPMQQQFAKLTAAGHGFAATFGVGPEGTAAAIKFNAELMEKLNGGTESLRKEIGENIAAMAIYRKGMGLTANQQATLIALADAQGKSITEVQHQYAKFSLDMGKRFGLDSKLIGQAMADMTSDVANFGTLSTRELAQVATYTQKLGIETKALQGVVKKYDDFESAAKSAAMLNQTFGMQVDVLKLLKDEDPASRLNQLQRSFQATGRSYEQLSRAERNRLADLSGLDAKSAQLAFSQKGLSMSYEDIQSAGEESEVGFKDINETLKELSKNMKKLFVEPSAFKNFLGAFTRGFEKGVISTKVYLSIMRNLRGSLKVVEKAGKDVGKAFVDLFPGVKQMLTGLRDFFDPSSTKQRMSKVVASFKEFFRTLQDGPSAARNAVSKLWDDLTGNFTSFFGGKSGTTSKIMEGLKTFGAVLGNVALNFGIKVLENVSKGFRVVGDFFKNLKNGDMTFGAALEEALGANFNIGGFFSDAFGDAFSDIGNVIMTDLWPSLRDAFLNMWDYVYEDVLKPLWEDTLKPGLKVIGNLLWEGIKELGSFLFDAWWGAVTASFKEGNYGKSAAIFLAPLIVMFGGLAASAASAFLTVFGPAIGNGIVNALKKGDLISKIGKFASKMGGAGTKMSNLFSSGFSSGFGKLLGKAGPWAMLVDVASNVSKTMENMGEESIERYGMGATKAGAGLSSVIQTLTLGLLPESMYTSIAEWFAEFFGGGEQGGFIGILKQNLTTAFALISDLLMGLWDVVKGLWDVIMGILTFDLGRISQGLMKVFAGIGNMIFQMGVTVTESVLNAIKGLVSKARNIPGLGKLIPAGAEEALDRYIGNVQNAAAESRRINADIQAQQSQRQQQQAADEAAKKAASAQQQATPQTDQQQAQTRLSSLRATESMLNEIKKLEGIDKKLEDAIKTMPGDSKIEQIKTMTSELVANLNKTFAAMQEELTGVKIDESFKDDMFDNKIMSNIQGIVSLKESIEKMAESGPSPRRIKSAMIQLKDSLIEISSKSETINAEATKINTDFGTGSTQMFGVVATAVEALKNLGNSLIGVQTLELNPDSITNKMSDMKTSLENLKTGMNDMRSILSDLGNFGSEKSVEEGFVGPTQAFNVAKSLAPIDIMLQSVKKTINNLKDVQETGLKDDLFKGQVGLIKSSMTSVKTNVDAAVKVLEGPPIKNDKVQVYLDSVYDMIYDVDDIVRNFVTLLPDNVIAKAQQTVAAITDMENSFRAISNKEVVATAIKIGESFQGGGTVNFRHENININLAVKVEMSAEEIARGIIKTTVRGASGKADEEIKIVTNPEKPDFSF
jgi:hypothetical protein